jgi:membrane protease YdiL (CAAX protease family)
MDQNKERTKAQIPKVIGRIVIALIIGAFVLGVSTSIAITISSRIPALVQSLPMGEGFIIQLCFLVVSILLILVLSKGAISHYGFKLGKSVKWPQIVVLGLMVGILGALVQSIVPGEIPNESENASFIDLLIGVWLLASIAEEVFTRGLIQGFLAPMARFGFYLWRIRISIPVLISSLFFGFMHLGILSTGADFLPVIIIVIFAFFLGVIAGYQREKSESLIPAIVVHMFGNIGSWLTSIMFNF